MMQITSLKFWTAHIREIGIACIFISLVTWSVDVAGIISACPYCRVQRTIIGILGMTLLLRRQHSWILFYISCAIAALGVNVAAAQNFMGWMKISVGEFTFNNPIYFDGFLLSGAALFIITGQILLLHCSMKTSA